MKKLSLLLAIVMLISSIGLAAFAEEAEPAATSSRFKSYEEVNAAITIIPAEGDQVELGYLNGVTEILEVDGLKFKDLNGNGNTDASGGSTVTLSDYNNNGGGPGGGGPGGGGGHPGGW